MGQKKCIEGIFMGETLNFHYFNLYSFQKKIKSMGQKKCLEGIFMGETLEIFKSD